MPTDLSLPAAVENRSSIHPCRPLSQGDHPGSALSAAEGVGKAVAVRDDLDLTGAGAVPAQDDPKQSWVFDSSDPEVRHQLPEVMDEVLLPFELKQQLRKNGPSVGYLSRTRFGELSLVDGEAPDSFSGATGLVGRRHSGDRVAVLLVVGGAQVIRQGHRSTCARRGDLFVFDGDEVTTVDIPDRVRTLSVVGPRSHILGSGDAAHGPLEPSRPGAHLLGQHMQALEASLSGMTQSEKMVAAEATTLLIRLAVSTTASSSLGHETMHMALVGPIRSYIEAHLSDYDLDVTRVANQFAISVRSVYAIFEEAGESFGTFVRRRRLESVRAHILDRPDVPIAVIGAAWAYPNASSLSRAYRRQFGASPQHDRLRAEPDQVDEPGLENRRRSRLTLSCQVCRNRQLAAH